jgi:hypothetical protein
VIANEPQAAVLPGRDLIGIIRFGYRKQSMHWNIDEADSADRYARGSDYQSHGLTERALCP